MKKLNNKGFILAETLIVCVFLMIMFTMIYSNYYPIIGEYEKRENYDDVDGKYVAYWVKKLIESDAYQLTLDENYYGEDIVESSKRRIQSMNRYGYMRFECKDLIAEDNQRDICAALLTSLEIANCDSQGNGCDIYITHYQIGAPSGQKMTPNFKNSVRDNTLRRYQEYCLDGEDEATCKNAYFAACCQQKGLKSCHYVETSYMPATYVSSEDGITESDEFNEIARYCKRLTNARIFSSYFKDYVVSLPNYSIFHATTDANYRVIVTVHHQKDYNNYYSFSTMEVVK